MTEEPAKYKREIREYEVVTNTPEGKKTVTKTYGYVKELDEAIRPLLEFFKGIEVDGDIIKLFDESHHDYNKMMDMAQDLNAIVIAQLIEDAEMDGVVDDGYKQAYVNWLKMNLLLFTTVPYWRSRIGHMIWHFVCAANPDAYYPVVWEDHFDPTEWYVIGEPQRPKDNNKISAFSLPD
jgi:hypothetical protein